MPNKKNLLTPEIAAKIKKLAATNDLYQHELAALVKVNQGSGKRCKEVAPAP